MVTSAPNSELVNYIWNYLHQGYSLTSIRDSLKQQKYKEKEINVAVDYIYANYYYGQNPDSYRQPYPETQAKPGHHDSGKSHAPMFWIILVVGLVLIGVSFAVILSLGGGDETNPRGTEIVIEESPDKNLIPDPKPSVPETEPEVENDPEPETPNPQTGTPVVVPPRDIPKTIKDPYKAGESYTLRQIELKVEYFSATNPKEAIKFCDEHEKEVEKYFCYRDVAVGSGNPAYCDKISESKYGDDCYMSTVLENVDSGNSCNSIQDSRKKENCYTIVDINEEARKIQDVGAPIVEDDGSSEEAAEYYAVVANFY